MAFVHHQATKLDEQTKGSEDQWVTIQEQSVTIEKQSQMIEQLEELNKVRIDELFFNNS